MTGKAFSMRYSFKLYVAGKSARSVRALENLRALGEQALAGGYRLEVIDVLEQPQRAEDDRVLATPTLIKESPAPVRRFIGDLSAWEQVLSDLEVAPPAADVLPFPGRGDVDSRRLVER